MRLFVLLGMPCWALAGHAAGGEDSHASPAPGSAASELPSAWASLPPAEIAEKNLDYRALAALMLAGNPRLRAAEAAARAGEGEQLQAGLYPNPTAEAEIEDYEMGAGGIDGSQSTLRITQPILWGAKRRDRVAVARAEVDALRLERQRLEMDLLSELRVVYDDLLFVRQARRLNDELTSFTRRSLEIARTRFDLRASPQSDVSRAEVEVFDLTLDARRLDEEEARSLARLGELLGGMALAPERIHGDFAPALNDGIETATLRDRLLREHPEALIAQAETEIAQARLAREKSERLPELSISAGYGRQHAQGDNVVEAAVGIELPLFDRNRGSISAARARIEAAGYAELSLRNRLSAQFDAALAELTATRERREYHTRHVMPSATHAFDQVQEGYQAGKLSFLDLIDAQRTLTSARLQQLQLIREIRRAEGRLAGLVGPEILTLGFDSITEGTQP